ncbi:zinc finger protein 624-like isoform X1 [Anopheles merus]|uniref:zinc finger protein 624-like isoform X1 n=1 Tax=Anopheles merus TaxID=30066 RepID=UPI001BE4A578|nr:zinc finger protein 624-like isoform X1 [Anopheles merus]
MNIAMLETIINSASASVCRLCLSYDASEYVSLDANESDSLVAIINKCTGIKVRGKINNIANKICNDCRNVVVKFNQLRERCLASDKILLDLCRKRNRLTPKLLSSMPSLAKGYYGEHEQQETFTPTETNANIIIVQSTSTEAIVPETDEMLSTDSHKQVDLGPKDNREVDAPTLVCCGCNPSPEFNTTAELTVHCDNHHKKYRVSDGSIRPFECNICFERFLTPSLLKHHQTRPYRKRVHICRSCGSAYFTNSALNRHEKVCTVVDKNYTCEECGKRFRQIITLKNHRKLHQAEKIFACPVCGKTFKQKFEITIHMVTHTGEQPYPCDQCPARFKRKQALKNHQNRHQNPRPFKCESCDEWFGNPTARKFHRLTVHEGLDPFRCDQCGVSYGRRLRLTQHMKKVHGEVG